jgi:hypothetical protein
MDIKDIYWIAALLDGEGHFGNSFESKYPRITIAMTDEDTIIRARDIMNSKALIHKENRNPLNWKDQYILRINSHYAIGWMMILYCHPYMSARRKEQIKQVLSEWRKTNSHNSVTTLTGKNLIRFIARKHEISWHEARQRLIDGRYARDSEGRIYTGSLLPKKITENKPFVNPF